MNMRDGYEALLDAIARGLEPDPNLTVDEWADEFGEVPKETGAAEPGKYRTSRTPHARFPMRCLSAGHPCKRLVLKGASQMLKTQVGLHFLCETIHQRPKNFLWLVPTGKLHKRAVERIDKVIKATPVIRDKVAKRQSRKATNNNDIKSYPGGALYLATSGAAANMSELAVTYVVYDEIDRSKENVGGEGASHKLAEARQTSHERDKKSYYPSSPTIEGESPIDDLYKLGTQREALAECIHCGHAQPLDFFKADGTPRLVMSEDGKRAMYPCCECGGLHEESDKTRMFVRGLWSDGVPGDGETESLTISAMFLPYGWFPWISLLKEYLEAKEALEAGNDQPMITFYNTRLARCWARSKESTRYEALLARAEPYELGTVPQGGVILTAAIDCQAYRLEMKVVAWGPGMESWVVDYQVIHGAPSEQATWDKADQLLRTRYRHASGCMLGIDAAFVNADGKGGTAQDVYLFTGPRRRRNIFSVKGHSRPGRPILSAKPTLVDIDHRGKSQKQGAQLWFVGPDTAKDYLQARWDRSAGPGAVHFSQQLPDAYFKGLTAEYRTTKFKRGRKVSYWEQKKGEANEPLDLMVYNLGAAYYLGLQRKNDHHWQLLRDRLMPSQGDLLSPVDTYPQPESPAKPDESAPPPRRVDPAPTPAPAPAAIVVGGKISLGGR